VKNTTQRSVILKRVWVKRTAPIVSLIGVAALIALGGPDGSAEASSGYDPLPHVVAAGVLSDSRSGPSSEHMVEPAGRTPGASVTPEHWDLSLTPLTPGLSREDTTYAGHAVSVSRGANFGVVVGKNVSGNTAGFISIDAPSAPSQYSFAVASNSGQRVVLTPRADGAILVTSTSGRFVNLVQAPWAIDANGRHLKTSYRVVGDTITQTIDLAGAAFPVLADPSLSCGILNCTVQFNKNETHLIAAGAVASSTLIAWCARGGPELAFACTVGAGAIVGNAILAQNQHGCLEIHAAGTPPLVTWWTWSYAGGYCK
jgi:hypothetical protein